MSNQACPQKWLQIYHVRPQGDVVCDQQRTVRCHERGGAFSVGFKTTGTILILALLIVSVMKYYIDLLSIAICGLLYYFCELSDPKIGMAMAT